MSTVVPSHCTNLGVGLGLRAIHYDHILKARPKVSWFEVTTENFMGIEGGSGGRPVGVLEKIREHYPIVFHGVSLSIGSVDPLDEKYLLGVRQLAQRFSPEWISDHLCWTGVGGKNLHDLLPLPFTTEAVRHVAERVKRVQDFLGRRILLENVSSYVEFAESEMREWEFLTEITEQADCGILLDVNNIYVSSVNHGFDPLDYLNGVPAKRVGQFHLAGYTEYETHIIDTHDHPVSEPVWELFHEAVERFPDVSVLLERDGNIPPFDDLFEELQRASEIVDANRSKKFGRAGAVVLTGHHG